MGDIQKQKKFIQDELAQPTNEEEGQKEDIHGEVPLSPKDLMDLRVSKLLEMKSIVKEYYRDGIFEQCVGDEIAQILKSAQQVKKKMAVKESAGTQQIKSNNIQSGEEGQLLETLWQSQEVTKRC